MTEPSTPTPDAPTPDVPTPVVPTPDAPTPDAPTPVVPTPDAPVPDAVAALRRFNRSYTQRIGVLDESFLGSGRPLGAARLLFEIGPSGAAVHDLRSRLGLDSGYLSRLLRRLEDDGTVALAPDPTDRRRRVAALTERGRREWHELDRRSDELANRLLSPLDRTRRDRLCEALALADRLLRASTITLEEVPPRSAAATGAMRAYFDELDRRFPTGFDPGDALAEGADAMAAPDGAFVVARAGGTTAGCGGLQRIDDETAEIKRMWVHPDWRGAGVGARLLTDLERRAVRRGFWRVVLDTNATLSEAIAMYRRRGYTPIERYNDNPYAQRWFAKTLADVADSPT